MIGYCALIPERRKTALEGLTLCGLPLCGLRVPMGRWEDRRLKRGAKHLYRARVRQVLTTAEFPYWEILRGQGLRPVDPAPMLRRLAPRLALEWLRARGTDPERAVVVLRGGSAAELRPAAEALCPLVGGLVLTAPDSERLSYRLRANYGMAPLEEGGAGQSDLALHFQAGLPDRGEAVFALWPGGGQIPGLRLSIPELPGSEVCDPLPLLAALWETGRLAPGEVEVDFS